MNTTALGNSDLQVPRLGVGAMTWGNPSGLARFTPAKLAYGGAHGFDEEQRALEVSLEAGVTLFDTAEMYNGKSPAQVALRWLIENERVLPIPGAKNGKQAADNAGALAFRLTPGEIEALDQATLAWRA